MIIFGLSAGLQSGACTSICPKSDQESEDLGQGLRGVGFRAQGLGFRA